MLLQLPEYIIPFVRCINLETMSIAMSGRTLSAILIIIRPKIPIAGSECSGEEMSVDDSKEEVSDRPLELLPVESELPIGGFFSFIQM